MANQQNTPPAEAARWAIQRQIDRQYFDGDGWNYDAAKAYRTPRREEAVNIAAYLQRITPGWVRVALISN